MSPGAERNRLPAGPAPELPRTTISLTPATRDRLRAQGMKGESYDELINRLLAELETARAVPAPTRSNEVEFEPVRPGASTSTRRNR